MGRLLLAIAHAGRLLACLVADDPATLDPADAFEMFRALRNASGLCEPPCADIRERAVTEKAIELAQGKVDQLRRELADCAQRREELVRQESEMAAGPEADCLMPSERQLMQLIRYESLLDRQLHRALSEFRRRREKRGSGTDRGREARKRRSEEAMEGRSDGGTEGSQ
jgi:hypothetical protein